VAGDTRSGDRQPSLTDVAGLAGASHMTASRVINGTGPVGPETRARVTAAIEELTTDPIPPRAHW
jgi:DNA-binding LacI/PurR family transcriptional regulator